MKAHFIAFENSPTKKALDATTIERDNLRNENNALKSQLAQKDATISSLSAQAGEVNTWKNYYNSAQVQVNGLSSQLCQSQSEIQSLKVQITEQDRLKQENLNLSKRINELQKSNTESIASGTQTDDNAELISKSTQIEINSSTTDTQTGEQDDLATKELEVKLAQAETKIDFITRLFDEARQEKAELKQEKTELQKELKVYKKSLLKKHDLSVNQSIEIEKLRQEVLEMSQSQFSISHSDKEEDLSPLLVRSPQKSFTLPGTRTTVSQLVDTQELMQYMKAKKGYGESMLSSMLEPLHFDAENISLDTNSRLVGENFTVIDKDVS